MAQIVRCRNDCGDCGNVWESLEAFFDDGGDMSGCPDCECPALY